MKLFLIKFNQTVETRQSVKALRNTDIDVANKVKLFFINII